MKWMTPRARNTALFGFALLTFLLVTGCQTTNTGSAGSADNDKLQELLRMQSGEVRSSNFTIREGDKVRITFAGAPNLNTSQLVRRDGKIEMPLLGELQAANQTPAQLEQEILKRYGNQLLSKEVTVTVDSASYDVFVTGAVVKPGKVSAVRPMSALEAVMECGGPDYVRANLKEVTVIRQENGRSKNYRLNLREILDGKRSETFYLKPSDIIYVRERFNWF
ncbi:MAG: polysaccharide biosynthesis/export family protein [Limisphaerales bacterium]